MLVVADDFFGAAAITPGKSCSAAGDHSEVFHQPFLMAGSANPLVALAQSLQDGLRQAFAREARECAGETLDFGVADTERHNSIIYKIVLYIQKEKQQAEM
jgi:hypothetical protein